MFEAALTYLRDSDDGARTVIIGGLLTMFAFLLVPVLPVLGYLARVLERTADGDDDAPTFDDWERLFVDGLKMAAVAVAFLVVPAVVAGAFVVSGAAVAVTADLNVAGALLALAGLALSTVVGLAAWYVLPAALARFAREGTVGAAFEFGALRPVLTTSTYATGWLYGLVIAVAAGAVVGLLGTVPVLGWLAGLFVSFYGGVAAFYCYGRAYGETVHVEVDEGPTLDAEQPAV